MICSAIRRDRPALVKGLGLPVRRDAGTGRSVFAYTSEIDAWLQSSKAAEAPVPGPVPDIQTPPALVMTWRPRAGVRQRPLAAVVVVALVIGLLDSPAGDLGR